MSTHGDGDEGAPKEPDYEVGYCRPPKSKQFQKGHKRGGGRKRGSRNLRTIVEAEIFSPVTFKENGKTVRSNKLTAIIRTQTNKAAMGDPRATKVVLEMAATYCPPPEPEGESYTLNDAERAVLKSHIAMKELLLGGTEND
ncbi:MAG: hypothetical protein NVS3B5_21440 [Sphingomicrobium sp.]